MAAGLTVYNNDNKIQIDGAFKNLQLSRKIVLSGTGDTSGTFADGEVLAAVGGTTSQNIDAYCTNTPTGWKCSVKTFVSGMAVYVFTTKATASNHGVGLEVYDDNGVIVYNSNEKHPVVMGFGNFDSTAVGRATKPAIAVCQHRRNTYNQNYVETGFEQQNETRSVWHDAVYGYVDEEYQTFEPVDAVYEWVAGHYENQWVAGHYENQYVPGTYQYNPLTGQYEWTSGGYQNVWVPGGYQQVWVEGQYRLVTPAHTEFVTKTRRVYKLITPGGYEYITELVTYYCEYETLYYKFNDTNFRLSSGNIVSATVAEGTSGHATKKLVSKTTVPSSGGVQTGQNEAYWGSSYKYTQIVVDTRSWILFDVNGL